MIGENCEQTLKEWDNGRCKRRRKKRKKRDDAREEEGKGKVSGNTRGGREEEKIEK